MRRGPVSRRWRSEPRDRGAADALELVLLAPAVFGLALLVMSFGRQVDARAQVQTAAEAAAQAAALERTWSEAQAAAHRTANAMLTSTDSCANPEVDVVRETERHIGSDAGMIRVTVKCTASNRGLEVVQPDDVQVQAEAFATVDLFRAGG